MARVVHAGGDATGSVVASALAEVITSGGRVELHENEFVLDLLMDGGRCVGAVSLGQEGELTVSLARAVVLACGGAGQVFAHTTNPLVATGDGHAMAYRAGAVMRDMEFMQFHPTAFYGKENPTLLLTEALRGEGAYLLDDAGERFMVGAHPRAELAPRDVVVRHMQAGLRPGQDRPRVAGRPPPRVRLPAGALPHRLQRAAEAGLRSVHPAHPGGARLPLLHRGRAHRHLGTDHHPRAVRLRRDGQHRHPRRQPPGLELAARGPGVRGAHGARAQPLPGRGRPGGAQGQARPGRRAARGQRPGRGRRGQGDAGPGDDRPVRHRPRAGTTWSKARATLAALQALAGSARARAWPSWSCSTC